MKLKMELALRPGMPRESIEEYTLCLPVALVMYHEILKAREEKILPEKASTGILSVEAGAAMRLLEILKHQVFSDTYPFVVDSDDEKAIDGFLERTRAVLSVFCEELTSESSTGPLTIERRNAIAYEALMALKMKDGMSIGKNTKREMGNFSQDLSGVNPEEGKQFAEAFVADFISRAMGKK